MNYTCQNNILHITGGYLLAIALVPVYVSMFPVWKYLSSQLSTTLLVLLPISATIILLFLVLFLFRKKIGSDSIVIIPVIIGMILCLAALFVPDPQLPAKRIHVAEYLILSCVVRYTLSFRLQGLSLLFFSIVFTAILGIHDELLQGFHPARTYGLKDMAVNSLGGAGGALIWHGLNLFERRISLPADDNTCRKTVSIIYLCFLLISLAGFAWPYSFFTAAHWLPAWPATMLIGSAVFFGLYKKMFVKKWRHGINAISIGAFSLLFYVFIPHITTIFFY